MDRRLLGIVVVRAHAEGPAGNPNRTRRRGLGLFQRRCDDHRASERNALGSGNMQPRGKALRNKTRMRYWTLVQYVPGMTADAGHRVANSANRTARCRVDGGQQGRLLQGLLQALTDTGVASPLACCIVAICRDQDCRNMEAATDQMLMKLKSGHF